MVEPDRLYDIHKRQRYADRCDHAVTLELADEKSIGQIIKCGDHHADNGGHGKL